MNDNGYRVRAERGEVQIGTWVTMVRTPAVLTLLQAAGLDFARVDMEHSPLSMETVADMATLARALDFPLVVRPPAGNREWITRLLDAGVWNLHVPQVDTPEQAAAVAACTRYAPLGERGMYGFGPHTMYRTLPPGEHMAAANARVHVTAMLETKGAFDRLDEIASVPGIDALTIGPTDLAQDLGVLGTPAQRDTLAQYRRRVVEAALAVDPGQHRLGRLVVPVPVRGQRAREIVLEANDDLVLFLRSRHVRPRPAGRGGDGGAAQESASGHRVRRAHGNLLRSRDHTRLRRTSPVIAA